MLEVEFSYPVSHAVALNEYRSLFPSESIMATPQIAPSLFGRARVERGFLGSHSDIGGSFADGDLARVALVWMVDQATAAGLRMDTLTSQQRTVIANPVLHDKSSNLYARGGPAPSVMGEDRVVRYGNGQAVRQKRAAVPSMTFSDTQQNDLINYSSQPRGIVSGTVDAAKYISWLNAHGYAIGMELR